MKTRVRTYSVEDNKKNSDSLTLGVLLFFSWIIASIFGFIEFREIPMGGFIISFIIALVLICIMKMYIKDNNKPIFTKAGIDYKVANELTNIEYSHKFRDFGETQRYAEKKVFWHTFYSHLSIVIAFWVPVLLIIISMNEYFIALMGKEYSAILLVGCAYLSLPIAYLILLYKNKTQLATKRIWFVSGAGKRKYSFFKRDLDTLSHFFFH